MLNQVIFNLVIFLMGYIFLFTLSSIGRHYRCVISYLIGIALWGIVSTLIIISQIKLNIYSVMCMYFIFVGIIYYSKNRYLEFARWKEEFLVCGGGCVVILFLTLVFYRYNFITLTPDSYLHVFYGWRIEEVGYFNEHLNYWGIGGYDLRMPFLPLIYAGSRMFGVDFFYTCFPIAGILTLLLVPFTVFKLCFYTKISTIARVTIAILCCISLLTIPTFWEQLFYVNNHLLVSAYFLLSFASVLFFKKDCRNDWLILAAICLGVTVLQRQEMLLFVSSVILVLLCCSNLNRKDYAVFLGIFTITVVPWLLYRIPLSNLESEGTGGVLFQLILFCFYPLSYFVIHFKVIRKNLSPYFGKIFFFVLVTVIAVFIKMDSEQVAASIKGLITLMGADHYVNVYWGITWLILIMCALTDVMILRSKEGMMFLSVIAAYSGYRLLIFSIPGSLVANEDLLVGNRILFHILPICITYIFYLFYYAFIRPIYIGNFTSK